MHVQNTNYRKQIHERVNNKHINVIMGALLVILLSIYSDSIRDLLPKKTISFFFTKNIYTKYVLLFTVIYFLIDFAYNNKQSPLFELGISAIIMILFIMYTKIHYNLTIIIFVLLGMVYFLNDMIIYKKKNNFDSNNTVYSKYSLLYRIKDSLIVLCFTLLIIGYIQYMCK